MVTGPAGLGPQDLLLFSSDPPETTEFLPLRQLLAPDGETFPESPHLPPHMDLGDHGALSFQVAKSFEAVLQRVAASGETHDANKADLLDGFEAVRFRYLGSDVTAYTATEDGPRLLGRPLTVFCEDVEVYRSDRTPARFCKIRAPTGTGTVLAYAFFDIHWRPDLWPLLTRTLEHTACVLIRNPQICSER